MAIKGSVFLSYARSDGAEVCNFFQETLQNAGYLAWRDISNLPGGDKWQQAIEDRIRAVDAVLLFLTPDAIGSENVQKEWEAALRLQKRLVPLIVGEVDLPDGLRTVNYRDIRDSAARSREPSIVQRDLEDEQTRLRSTFNQHHARMVSDISDSGKQRYLEGFVESCNTLLDAMPRPFPPEVVRMLLSLLSGLIDELAAGRDVTALVESMIAGTYTAAGWQEEGIYKLRIAEISQILQKVRNAIPTIPVQVVVVAMTRAEAEELESGQAYADLPAEWLQDFQSIRPMLPDDWLNHYGTTAEAWEPFTGAGSIATLLRNELQKLNQDLPTPLRFSFVELRDLVQPERRRTLRELRARGCLVVMDAVSSWHPKLHAAFRATSLDVSPSTLVVRVVPHETLDNVLTKVGFLLHEWLTCDFFHRANIDLDDKCETVTRLFSFQKWFHGRLRNAAPGSGAQQSSMRTYTNNFGG